MLSSAVFAVSVVSHSVLFPDVSWWYRALAETLIYSSTMKQKSLVYTQYVFICVADYSVILKLYVSPLTSHPYFKKLKMSCLYTS